MHPHVEGAYPGITSLYGCTFIGNALYGYRTRKEAYNNSMNGAIKVSAIKKRHTKQVWETQNSFYWVNFAPRATTTIPEQWKTW